MGSQERQRAAGLGSLGYRLNVVARRARADFERRLTEAGASFAAWSVLEVLHTAGPMIQRDLATALKVSGQTVNRQVDRLVAEGWLRREQVAADRRAQQVVLTDEGRAVHRRLAGASRSGNEQLVAGMSPEEEAAFDGLLDRVAANLPGTPDELHLKPDPEH